jgi:hypothetical protein
MVEYPGTRLPAALRDWGTNDFERTLQAEIMALDAGILPLQGVTGRGGRVDSRVDVTLISSHDGGQVIQAKVGVFFGEIIGGCSCGDDPFTQPAYCMLLVTIEKQTASAGFEVIEEPERDGI